MLSGPPATIARARQLRKTMTLPEVMLWQSLRLRPGGFKFRRQHPAGQYIVDFFCAQATLVIEVDGIVHSMGDQPARDEQRDATLRAQGVEVLRVAAVDILHDITNVVAGIIATAAQRIPLHHAERRGPPPRSGADQQEPSWTI